ncbi:protein P-30-like [Hyperolius riggenbachi]|uniref:protein P-30-like n=1 Tax=Hyperolius riggenbachi TaxID=752182 RepID=UPI0035A3B2A0
MDLLCQISLSRMSPKSLFLLIFGIVLSLCHPSSCQDWDMFQKKHFGDDARAICSKKFTCNKIMKMRENLYHCKQNNTFLCQPGPKTVQSLCTRYEKTTDITSRDEYVYYDCIREKKGACNCHPLT